MLFLLVAILLFFVKGIHSFPLSKLKHSIIIDPDGGLQPDEELWQYSPEDSEGATTDGAKPRKIRVGDMLIAVDTFTDVVGGGQMNAVMHQKWTWPGGVIPYRFNPREEFPSDKRSLIRQAMDLLEKVTCVRFVRRTRQKYFVNIESKKEGCFSDVGLIRTAYTASGMRMNLKGARCFQPLTILHELFHVLGFFHEHTRTGRDEYIEIHLENLKKDENLKPEQLTNQFAPQHTDNLGFDYDYESIMHYKATAYSNGKPVIVTKDPQYQDIIGQRTSLSYMDIAKVNELYCGFKAPYKSYMKSACQKNLVSVWLIILVLLFGLLFPFV